MVRYFRPMYASYELSQAVRARRLEIGLSQKSLAKLAGLSRTTISQVESGTLKDLSLTRTAALLQAIGLGLVITSAHPGRQVAAGGSKPLELAARTASTSYASALKPEVLGQALASGVVEPAFVPHVATLLEEAPVSLLAKVVEQVHADSGLPRETVWAHMRQLAMTFKIVRALWNDQS